MRKNISPQITRSMNDSFHDLFALIGVIQGEFFILFYLCLFVFIRG